MTVNTRWQSERVESRAATDTRCSATQVSANPTGFFDRLNMTYRHAAIDTV